MPTCTRPRLGAGFVPVPSQTLGAVPGATYAEKPPMFADEALAQRCLRSLVTLVAHATAIQDDVRILTDAWATTYDAGDCTPRQIVAALYAAHQPLHDAITLLEQAKQRCRQALEGPLRALVAPVEL